jgi:hypothetical protein
MFASTEDHPLANFFAPSLAPLSTLGQGCLGWLWMSHLAGVFPQVLLFVFALALCGMHFGCFVWAVCVICHVDGCCCARLECGSNSFVDHLFTQCNGTLGTHLMLGNIVRARSQEMPQVHKTNIRCEY